jgi:hypothetical protein
MAGSAGDPVRQDPFERIVEVSWNTAAIGILQIDYPNANTFVVDYSYLTEGSFPAGEYGNGDEISSADAAASASFVTFQFSMTDSNPVAAINSGYVWAPAYYAGGGGLTALLVAPSGGSSEVYAEQYDNVRSEFSGPNQRFVEGKADPRDFTGEGTLGCTEALLPEMVPFNDFVNIADPWGALGAGSWDRSYTVGTSSYLAWQPLIRDNLDTDFHETSWSLGEQQKNYSNGMNTDSYLINFQLLGTGPLPIVCYGTEYGDGPFDGCVSPFLTADTVVTLTLRIYAGGNFFVGPGRTIANVGGTLLKDFTMTLPWSHAGASPGLTPLAWISKTGIASP